MNQKKYYKICKLCKINKSLEEFNIHHNHNNLITLRTECKLCQYQKNKKYRINNLQKIKETNKNYYDRNKEEIRKQTKIYYENNKNKILKKEKIKRQIPEIKKKRNEKLKERRKNDIQFYLKHIIATRIRKCLRNKSMIKSLKTLELLGCSLEELKRYLEKQFKPEMNWSNWGIYGWHIDHIKPCSSFDLRNIEQQKQCFHYTNLQPLWAEENLKKSDKYDNKM